MGPLLCLISAACFGAMGIFGKLAFAAGVSPPALLLVRFILAAVILLALLLIRSQRRQSVPVAAPKREQVRLSGRIVVTALGLGAIGYAAQAGLYFSALQRMDASLLSLVLYSYPLMVTVMAVLLGRDKITGAKVLALLVASVGTLLVLLQAVGSRVDYVGVLLAVGSAVTYTAYILIADTVVRVLSPLALSALVMSGGAVTMAVWALFSGGLDLSFGAQGWFWLACIAVVSTVLAMLTFFAGMKRTGPSTAAIISTFEPVVTTALAALVLSEFLTPLQLLGGALVLLSVVVLQLRAKEQLEASDADDLPSRQRGAKACPAHAGSSPVRPPPGADRLSCRR